MPLFPLAPPLILVSPPLIETSHPPLLLLIIAPPLFAHCVPILPKYVSYDNFVLINIQM